MQAANQFTPEQLIVAGRRAEAQGQPAYALQFYRYVADHFSASTEAYEARDALFRLTPPTEQPLNTRPPATGYGAPPHGANQVPQPLAHGQPLHLQPHQPTPVQPAPQTSLGDLRPHHEPPHREAAAEPASRARGDARAERVKPKATRAAEVYDTSVMLRPARGYRIGRIVAAMLNTIGWLSLLGAIAIVPLMIAALTLKTFPKGLKESIAGNLLAFGGATFGLLLIGLFAIFAAQVARATFDTADATRALFEANSGGE